jgi:NaMN:DMB phosphoribosyltransferase
MNTTPAAAVLRDFAAEREADAVKRATWSECVADATRHIGFEHIGSSAWTVIDRCEKMRNVTDRELAVMLAAMHRMVTRGKVSDARHAVLAGLTDCVSELQSEVRP